MSKPNIRQAPKGLPLKKDVKVDVVAGTQQEGTVADEAPRLTPLVDGADATERAVETLDEDEQEDEEERKEEEEDFEDKLDGVVQAPEQEQNFFDETNTVPDVESEGDRFRIMVQGSQSTNPNYANIIPFDLKLTKIKNADDRQNARLGAECLVLAVDMFGSKSLPFAHVWEEFKTEVDILSADGGFTAINLITNRQENTLSKKVSKLEQRANRGGILGGVRREQFPQEQGDAFG